MVLAVGILTGCETPVDYQGSTLEQSLTTDFELESSQPWFGLKATGELWAAWQGCEEENDSGHGEIDDGYMGEGGDDHGSDFEEDDGDKDHDDGKNCQGARPARDFYLQFDAQLKHERAKGSVTFEGVGEYKGVTFSGAVTWVKAGRAPGELFFGGEVTQGTVERKCYLFSVLDNGQGSLVETDRLQYRLYGSESSPCHEPGHLPQGYPIAVYEGNLVVH